MYVINIPTYSTLMVGGWNDIDERVCTLKRLS